MEKLQRETLIRVRDEMASYPWDEEEIAELVAPQMGVIAGLQRLLERLEELRRLDLGATPPASGPS